MAVKTYAKGVNTKLSKNLNVSEFACHGSGCCSEVKIDDKLVEYVQKIRDHFDMPVIINSGYRCPTHNKRIGGATNSYHARGMAADIVVKGIAPAEVAKYAESIGIKGIGLYETEKDGYFVHVDARATKAFWYGQKEAYRSTFGGSTKKAQSYTQKQFVKDIQMVLGVTVDGIAGPETLGETITLSAVLNRKHPAIYHVQRRLRELGYAEVGVVDGVAGGKFTSAVKHFQKDNGIVDDGEITARCETWKKLLGME